MNHHRDILPRLEAFALLVLFLLVILALQLENVFASFVDQPVQRLVDFLKIHTAVFVELKRVEKDLKVYTVHQA